MAPKDDKRKTGTEDDSAVNRAKRPGLPDPSSVIGVKQFTSRKGKHYRILKTNQKDAYENDDENET